MALIASDFAPFRFKVLVSSPESNSLRHMFFAERAGSKIEGVGFRGSYPRPHTPPAHRHTHQPPQPTGRRARMWVSASHLAAVVAVVVPGVGPAAEDQQSWDRRSWADGRRCA